MDGRTLFGGQTDDGGPASMSIVLQDQRP